MSGLAIPGVNPALMRWLGPTLFWFADRPRDGQTFEIPSGEWHVLGSAQDPRDGGWLVDCEIDIIYATDIEGRRL